MRRTRLIAAAAATVLATTGVLGGCSLLPGGPEATAPATGDQAPPEGQDALAPFYSQQIDWSQCQGGECGTLEVPMDYAAPDGGKIKLALFRAKARKQSGRLGSLVVNPGGPGGSGVEYAQYADFIVSGQIRDRFDIVGFDPRGVGRSHPIDCVSDAELDDFLGIDPTPDDPAEVTEVRAAGKSFAEACGKNAGPLLGHVSTRDVARDLDVLRSALGDGKLTYLGKSYGTYLGATYIDMFPDRAGRMVLDGVLPPDITSTEMNIGQAKGFDQATRAWAEDCVDQGQCPLGSNVDEVLEAMKKGLRQLDSNPVTTTDGFELTEGWGTLGVARAMYEQGLWSTLTTSLVDLKQGRGDKLASLAMDYADRHPDGSYKGNIMEVIYAVNCVDRPEPTGTEAERAQQEVRDAAPIWGEAMSWGSGACESWPVEASGEPKKVTGEGAEPILVVGTTRDPATPYEWAQRLNDQLKNSALITHEGDGHTAYMRQNACVDKAVDAYWLTGNLPEGGDITCS